MIYLVYERIPLLDGASQFTQENVLIQHEHYHFRVIYFIQIFNFIKTVATNNLIVSFFICAQSVG